MFTTEEVYDYDDFSFWEAQKCEKGQLTMKMLQ